MSKERGKAKTLVGTVVSNKMDKTVVVQVSHRVLHTTYKKFVSRHVKYKAHDAENACEEGDRVRIRETRPLSRDKRWRVVETIEKAVRA